MPQSTLAAKPDVSWAALGLASVALAALFFTSGLAWPIPVLAIVLWCAPGVTFRFPHDSFTPWIMRLIGFGLMGLSGVGKAALGADGLFDARTLNTLGLIASVELVLQFWREAPRSRFQGSILLWAGLVFLAASNTYGWHIDIASPLFALFMVLALRDFRPVKIETSRPSRRQTVARSTSYRAAGGWRWGLLSVALLLGFAMSSSVQFLRNELMSLGLDFLFNRPMPQVAGISSQPRLSSRFRGSDSPLRVLRIKGDLNDAHLRAASFDIYANGTWGAPLTERRTTPLPNNPVPGARIQITRLVDDANKVLFAPLNSAAVLPGAGSTIEYNVEQGGPLKAEDPAPYEYEVVESRDNYEGFPVHQGPLTGSINDEQRARYLQLPAEFDSRVRELANQITRSDSHQVERVQSIVTYLMANHQYSSEARRGGGDPVANFVLGKRSAHCEYFASAAALLLRCVGVPSRYVVGYYAHETDGDGLLVRQRDAHAWTECWIDGVGWVSIDATPASGRPESKPPVPWWQRGWEKLQDGFMRLREQMAHLSREQWGGVLVAILVLWGISRWRMTRRQSTSDEAGELYFSPDARLKLAATRFENWLRHAGITVPDATSWSKYFATLPEEEFAGRKLAQQFVREYEEARWRQRDDETLGHVLQLVEELEAQPVGERKS